MKKASMKGVEPPPWWAKGRSRRSVPTAISPANAYIRMSGDARALEGTERGLTVSRTGPISSWRGWRITLSPGLGFQPLGNLGL